MRFTLLLGLIFLLTTGSLRAVEMSNAVARATALLKPGTTLEALRRELSQRMHQRELSRGGSIQAKAEWLLANMPSEAANTLSEADRALAGLLVLPGTKGKPFDVGNPPRWHNNPLQDNEYVFTLNRMGHWSILLHAWRLSGRRVYAEKVANELDDWLRTCPRPPLPDNLSADALTPYSATAPWRILEAGIRMNGAWPEAVEQLIDDPLLTPELLARLVISVHEHGEALATVSPRLWPRADHNHFLTESVGLLAISALLPELAEAGRWRDQAIRQLARCIRAQFVADGGQIEGCPHYHDICTIELCRALGLAKEAGARFPADTLAQLHRMIDYSQSLPSGLA